MDELVCIVCPRGCTMKIEGEGDSLSVTGNSCKRGYNFAVGEKIKPMRTICSVVKTTFKEYPVLPVRVSSDIPKDRIFDVMKEINKVVVSERIGRGDKVIENVLDLGVDVIATSDMLKTDSGE